MKNKHTYNIGLAWTGTSNLDKRNRLRYERVYELSFKNKPAILGSADATFYGDDRLYNPEEMLLSALTSCYMMSFFYLCGLKNIKISSYKDNPIGIIKVNANGSGQFEEVTLHPKVVVEQGELKQVEEVFAKAHEYCFIARSCSFKIVHQPTIVFD